MKHRTTPLLAAAAAALLLSACGSDDTSTSVPAVSESTPDAADAPAGDAAMMPIGDGNVGGPVVDGRLYTIDSIDIAESSPEQLTVNFTGSDPSCTAADAVASVTGSNVIVELRVGITEDAMSRSCRAGTDFEQSVTIALDQPLDGREVFPAVPASADG